MLLPHGSGKTAVLVERIIHKIIDDKIDIDKILVVTFTNAAASEMRERILDAIYKKLEESPDDINLQRQLTLLNKASICTIHSFCLDVIRNNFYEIDTSANFRIADTAEIELLKSEVIEDIFEEKYLNQDKGFLKLLDTYTGYRGDEPLIELILDIYNYIQSSPFPEKWLEEKVEMLNIKENCDFSETIWGKILLKDIKSNIYECILKLTKMHEETTKFDELAKYSSVLESDINNLYAIYNYSETWESTFRNINEMIWEKWPVDRKVTNDLKNDAKDIRDKVKKQFAGIKILQNSEDAIFDIKEMYKILKELQNLIIEFSNNFAEKKKEKNIIDFHDIEHFALKILLKEENGTIVETEVAKKYKEKFNEIAIDEYQDSNLVQEYILNSISNKQNIFMVGDVKQSIYKFRQARPELFLEKYMKYKLKEQKKDNESGLKIQLFKNFRSRENVLDVTNLVFDNIMSADLGDVDYTKDEYLNYGAGYKEPEEKVDFAGNAELHIIDLKEEGEECYKDENQISDEEVETEENEERIENSVLEAKFVASKIKELLESNYQVFDKKKKDYRKITYKDICVLLRATSATAPIYEKEISELNLPVFSDTSTTYLDSMEVQTILALLKIIDNPLQDIPLVTVLRSNIGGFNDDDLVEIRLADRKSSFYEAMLKARLIVKEPLKDKIENMVNNLEKWNKEEKYNDLDEFIWKLYTETGYYHYVNLLPNGNLRQANLKLLFEKAKQYEKASFKGLFNFIHFIDKVKTSSSDMGSAKLIGENDNVIRIMSIHKSKGLEFPVVFLAGTGKKFNLQDLNKPILMHQDIGFGPKLIDSEKRVEYNTLAKEAIKIISKKETISEEMRVLYVALTRAKEKLFITGISKDIKKKMQEKEQLLNIYQSKPGKRIKYQLVEKYASYLDWLELVYINNKQNSEKIINLVEHKKDEIIKSLQSYEIEAINVKKALEEKLKEVNDIEESDKYTDIKEKLNWSYSYLESSKIPNKTSVTKLKQMQEENISLEEIIEKTKQSSNLTYRPKFVEEKKALSPAQKGTLMHYCVQKLDETKDYSEEKIEEFLQDLYKNEMITELELKSVNRKALIKYVNSDLWKQLKEAKEVHKEQPFYTYIPAKSIYENADEKENILVQGIIDLYYIDKEGRVILVDYKTDYIKDGDERILEEKYKIQLDLYKKALEEALNQKVYKAMIYPLS